MYKNDVIIVDQNFMANEQCTKCVYKVRKVSSNVRPSNRDFFQSQVPFLCHVVFKDGINLILGMWRKSSSGQGLETSLRSDRFGVSVLTTVGL